MELRSHGAMLLQIVLYLIGLLSQPATICCERYTSVDGIANWSQETEKFINRLNELVHRHEVRLSQLKRARESLIPLKQEVQAKALIDPVHVFVTLNRLRSAYNVVRRHQEENFIHITPDYENESDFTDLETSDDVDPDFFETHIQEDLRGSGVALLRLQAFYDLNLTHLVNGNVISDGSASFRMSASDCFELGKIAYRDEQYGPAILWLYASLESSMNEKNFHDAHDERENDQLIDDILDHMAFAAYKLGLLDYSAKLTKAWLERDPENERARENLEYYLDELASVSNNGSSYQDSASKAATETVVEQVSNGKYFESYKNLALDKYLVEDDETVRRLCRQTKLPTETLNKCQVGPSTFAGGYFYPGVELEVLSEKPKIVRIYNIVSSKEVEHLQRLARPNLQRSTIMLSSGQQTSDFRIAKTAWLSSDSDPIVERIEDRLAAILDVGMEKAELLQVVNYGLGGFYGPHLDSARASNASRNDSILVDQLKRSDRYATILVYLNDVNAGGSTVFPLLNLTVTPIGRSAVVWFNIMENGYSDERTLHTGCPVSLGSKWIAVKWPREEANTFPRRNQWWR